MPRFQVQSLVQACSDPCFSLTSMCLSPSSSLPSPLSKYKINIFFKNKQDNNNNNSSHHWQILTYIKAYSKPPHQVLEQWWFLVKTAIASPTYLALSRTCFPFPNSKLDILAYHGNGRSNTKYLETGWSVCPGVGKGRSTGSCVCANRDATSGALDSSPGKQPFGLCNNEILLAKWNAVF